MESFIFLLLAVVFLVNSSILYLENKPAWAIVALIMAHVCAFFFGFFLL